MHRTRSGLSALAVLVSLAALSAVAAGSITTAASAAATTAVTVRVEGTTSTLVLPNTVTLRAGTVNSDGVAGHTCSDLSAAGAIEAATRGKWTGTWSKSLRGYFISSIDGLAFPSTGAEYWAFWVNDAPASQGICGYVPKPGDSLLFFPDCYGKKCPPNDGVLGVKAPALVTAGRPASFTVTAYSDTSAKPSATPGAKLTGAGASATTGAGGTATMTFAHAGRVWLHVTAPHTVRTEVAICVHGTGATKCG